MDERQNVRETYFLFAYFSIFKMLAKYIMQSLILIPKLDTLWLQ